MVEEHRPHLNIYISLDCICRVKYLTKEEFITKFVNCINIKKDYQLCKHKEGLLLYK